ncbi:hypothetical protein K493DRAFT_295834 [Basidiobolus meristosporus CBS 931.73]|uniref:Carbohydrate-binding module family 19 domain-containing protein n=1 Tax=Basidiobolus meristosporus CBS 931.73 TaxID=1314790 RepID=A0A1Y1Z8U7_9FUNG|nr:hypothetical protein K493DRAFT_295834 [Basidiobolus meristosporus CBS 931.73]|eukprot:ORY06692.1 hypothetical protein K493DRAFT_295834 [Basidiobolus meristosporus CBS 931.73]
MLHISKVLTLIACTAVVAAYPQEAASCENDLSGCKDSGKSPEYAYCLNGQLVTQKCPSATFCYDQPGGEISCSIAGTIVASAAQQASGNLSEGPCDNTAPACVDSGKSAEYKYCMADQLYTFKCPSGFLCVKESDGYITCKTAASLSKPKTCKVPVPKKPTLIFDTATSTTFDYWPFQGL